jgi:hypothetical protein
MMRRHDRLMTPAELAFFSVLEPIVSQSYMISSKVPLADVISARQGEIHQAAINIVCNTYIDFVLTDIQSGVILCAIALESDGPKQADTTSHDGIVDDLFAHSCLPLLRIPCTWTYYPQALRAELLKAGIELPCAT